uniref:G_PROTEIN_RECEP_F1_2 domain-containing protein n=1 Tax=Parastrongyloides trichosuri TaxID=131310 RepID=A0A0N5A3T5_PARTI
MNLCSTVTDAWNYSGCILTIYLLPLVCIIGLLLNVACLIVFIFHRKHPIVPALISLSVCDSLQLFFSLFVLYIPALHQFSGSEFSSRLGQVSFISTGLFGPVLLTANCSSIWTMCYICIRRYRAISNPLSTLTHKASDWKILSCIALIAFIFNFRKWLEYEWKWIDLQNTNDTLYKQKIYDPSRRWFLAYEYKKFIYDVNYRIIWEIIVYPVCVYLIPCLLISVLHGKILTNMTDHKIESIGHKRRLAQEKRSAMLLISIVILFFVCHTGGLIVRFFDFSKYQSISWFIFMKDTANFLFNVNSCANPMVYFIFTRHFRDLHSTWSSSKFKNRNNMGGVPIIKNNLLVKVKFDSLHNNVEDFEEESI